MKARYRDLTAKYKNCRHQTEALFLSRTLQTFFNKFTKKGKKALARRHLRSAFSQLRLTIQRPLGSKLIWYSLRKLETPLELLYRRKGKERKIVPVPRRRNKKKASGLQNIYQARKQRGEREFSARVHNERLSLAGPSRQSALRLAHSAQNVLLYDSRTNLRRRWR